MTTRPCRARPASSSEATTAAPLLERLRPALAAALPGVRLDDATLLGEGWGSTGYRLPAAEGDTGGDWALRVPRSDSFREITGDLTIEVALLPLFEAAGLPTPRGARAILDGDSELAAVAHRLVEGAPGAPERIAGRARRARFAADVGTFLARLHAIDGDAARTAGVPELDLWPDRYARLVEECRDLLPPRSRTWLEATADRFVAAGGTSQAPRTLVHGDLGPQHLRVDEAGVLVGVIDFGDAMIADPAIDLAAFLWGYGWPLTERVITGYEAAGQALDLDARRRMQFYVDVVPLFLVRFGHQFEGGAVRRTGLRQFAARAAAETRRSGLRSEHGSQGAAALR